VSLDSPVLRIDPIIDDERTRIIVCCGSGGVGKTTTAAALGVRAAERGRKVVVLTIDPARRLAQSMGLTELDNTPRQVAGIGKSAGGELHAMMLDMKRTFDEVVLQHSDPQRARAILENPFYQSLSAGFAGTQEYMAMEKLGQLRALDEWDLIVVDTPPSRSALDFLDAPKRLGSFLDGKFIKLLMAPARAGGRAGMKFLNVGMSMMTGALDKVVGAQLLRDVQTFVAAMDSMFGGFRKRADATYRLLQASGTSFLVVAAPERDALREASYFVDRLAAEDMPLAGLVLNRVHDSGAAQLSAERALAAAEVLEDSLDAAETTASPGPKSDPKTGTETVLGSQRSGAGSASKPKPSTPVTHAATDGSAENLQNSRIVDQSRGKNGFRTEFSTGDGASPESPRAEAPEAPYDESPTPNNRTDQAEPHTAERLAAGLLRLHAERMHLVARERRTRDRFVSVHPDVPIVDVAALPGDVHDLAGLREIGERLAAGSDQPTAA
jgi:anion-transporting  ArsA/GET3 family ATPase